MWRKISLRLTVLLVAGVLALLPGGSAANPGDPYGRTRVFTRPYEFDYISWTLRALGAKLEQQSLTLPRYLPAEPQSALVLEYLDTLGRWQQVGAQIRAIYAEPGVTNPALISASLSQEQAALASRLQYLEPLAETILQGQVAVIAAEMGFSLGGQALPPVLYRSSPPPDALIVSPRSTIRQDSITSIGPGMDIEQITRLEEDVAGALDVSTLVVGIGGIGLYPTMVMQVTDINRLAEVVAHEWIHNYLMLRPLGVLYDMTPELRIINETSASIAGKEFGQAVVARYYPDHLPPPPAPAEAQSAKPPVNQPPAGPPPFDFQAEMRQTRLEAERLLAEGQIEQAEAYMESRRQVFWDNGYRIRRLNQAYFAFYGAYADQPGGAAGEDPVSAAVRSLRAQSPTLADFINQIAWVWSYERLSELAQTP